MTDGRRQLAATLGRIYPYRAAKQQAPVVAATVTKGFPNRPGTTSRSPVEPGMTGRGTIWPPEAVSVFLRLVRN